MNLTFESTSPFYQQAPADILVGTIPDEACLLSKIRSQEGRNQPVTILAIPPAPDWYSLPRLIRLLNHPEFAEVSFRVVVPDAIKAQAFLDGLWIQKPDSHPVTVNTLYHEHSRVQLRLVHGSISGAKTEALVNASNPALRLGAGISGALKDRFPGLQAEMDQARARFLLINGSPFNDGDSVTTGVPGTVNPRYIIHTATVAGTADVIEAGIRSMLNEVKRFGIRSVTIPALGTGTGGFPVPDFIRIFQSGIKEMNRDLHETTVEVIHLKLPVLTLMADELIRCGWIQVKENKK